MKRELANARRELRNLKTGQHENKRENVEGEMTADERTTHERTGYATCGPRCETCVEVRGVPTRPRKAVAEAAYFDYATVKSSQRGGEVKILVGAGPRGETFARAVHRKGAKFEDLELFLKVLQTRCGNIPVCCDQEECLREVVHSAAGRLGMPTGVNAVERSQANGRAEQRVRTLRERLQITVDARRRGAEIILDHLVAQWAVRHAEWIQNFSVKSDVDSSGGGTIKITPHEARTEDKAPSNVAGFWERIPVRSRINDGKQPTLMEDGSVRYNGSWEGRSVANHHELQSVLAKMKKTKTKGARLSGVRTWNQCQSWSETHV